MERYVKNVPKLWCEYTRHRHYVNIFIPSENLCIEIKSVWTLKMKDKVFIKQSTAKKIYMKFGY